MFKPIIHNLSPGDTGYAECQLYNNLLANKPTGNYTLVTKIGMQRAWKAMCEQALVKAQSVIGA